jgi:hypothetical protein
MKNNFFIITLSLIVGMCAGWFVKDFWDQESRRSKSMLAVIMAKDLAEKGDLDAAIKYSTYALALNNESPLAELQLKEYTRMRAKCLSPKKSGEEGREAATIDR